jgi:hypothetical protein
MKEHDSPAVGNVIRVGQLEIRYLQGAGNGCRMGCFELRVPAGSNVPPAHSHAANEEVVYVLEGTLRYRVGEETRDLQPGEVINTPDIGADYFREMASIINADGPPDRARLMATMQRFGLVPSAT